MRDSWVQASAEILLRSTDWSNRQERSRGEPSQDASGRARRESE